MPDLDVTENEIRYRVRDPGQFRKGSFRTKAVPGGVRLILAKLTAADNGHKAGSMIVQSVRFDTSAWTEDKVRTWIGEQKFAEEPDSAEFAAPPADLVEAGMELTGGMCTPPDPTTGELVASTGAQPDVGVPVTVSISKAQLDAAVRDVAAKIVSDAVVSMAADGNPRAALAARAKKHGIAIRDDAHLTPPAGFPADPEQYADPVNFSYPAHDVGHANNARARFRQMKGEPYSKKDQRKVYTRIVAAQLKHGATPAFDPKDAFDKMLAPEIKAKLRKVHNMAEHSNECEELCKVLHKMLGNEALSEDDKDFVAGCLDVAEQDREIPREKLQRLQGIALGMGMSWPKVYGPLGTAESSSTAYMRESGAHIVVGSDTGDMYLLNFRDIAKVETYNIPGVEIFAAGTYHGMAWPRADLEQIHKNFGALGDKIKVPLKLGHTNRVIEDSEDDSPPAVGWVSALRIDGDKLVADFSDVPKVVRDLINKRAYRRVSPEIYVNYVDGQGAIFGKTLKAVSLLGAAMPEIKTLQDITLLYREAPLGHQGSIVRLDYDLTASNGGAEEVDTKELEKIQKELADERAKREAAEKRAVALIEQAREQDIAHFVAGQIAKGVLVPAQETAAKNFMRAVYMCEESASADSVAKFAEMTGGKGLVAAFKGFVESNKPQIDMSERAPMPGAPRQDGSAPGAPAPTTPVAGAPPQKVATFTDGRGRVFTLVGSDILQSARDYITKHPGTRLEDAVANIERGVAL